MLQTKKASNNLLAFPAEPTRLELATSCVTGRRSNQTELRFQFLLYIHIKEHFQRNRRDSNSRPPAWQAGALTKLSYDSNFILYIHIKEHFQRNRRDSNSRPPAWQAGALTKLSYDSNFQIYKWTQGESNSWPLECHSSALPSELWAQLVIHFLFQCSLKKRIQN